LAKRRAVVAVALVFGLALALDAARVAYRREAAPKPAPALRPLAVVPPGPALVVSVDVRRLRATRAGEALLGKSIAELAGKTCESAVFADIDELVLALPGEAAGAASPGALGLVASGHFAGANVVACAERRVRARGGEPMKTTIGSFASVRDRRHVGEIAARDGLLVVSDGSYLRDLLDAADGHRADGTPAERERDQLHAEFRRVVGRGAPIVATLALPEGWLARTLADPEAELSPLATLRTAALRADVNAEVDVAGVIGCRDADGCERLERFFGAARADLATLLPGSAELLNRLELRRENARLELTARASTAELAKLWAQRDGAPGAAGVAAPQSQAP
jgi:hypothetical protein